ncbi:hypothetical protein ACLB2K_032586 [Fragaria x ananassa]
MNAMCVSASYSGCHPSSINLMEEEPASDPPPDDPDPELDLEEEYELELDSELDPDPDPDPDPAPAPEPLPPRPMPSPAPIPTPIPPRSIPRSFLATRPSESCNAKVETSKPARNKHFKLLGTNVRGDCVELFIAGDDSETGGDQREEIRSTNGQYYIKKVVLFADPSLCPSDFEALVMYERYDLVKRIKLAHFKSGQDALNWTRIDHYGVLLSDVTLYYKGRFLVCSDYNEQYRRGYFRVFSVDVSSKETKQFLDLCIFPCTISRAYLVESSEGDLMLVIRKVQSSEDDLCVKVFKLLSDFDGGLKWVEIKTIGNHGLFLDRNQCICVVSALEFPECHPNFIYLVDGTFDLIDLIKWIGVITQYQHYQQYGFHQRCALKIASYRQHMRVFRPVL